MRAKLTLVFEKKAFEEDRSWLVEVVDEYDEQAVFEFFGIGCDGPKESKIEFLED